MNRFLRQVIGTLLALAISGARPAAASEGETSAADESTTLALQLAPEQTTATRVVVVSTGQTLRDMLPWLKEVPMGVDDDPCVYCPAVGGGPYVLFFSPKHEASGEMVPADPLNAVIRYRTVKSDDGEFLLPAALRGRQCGEFRMVSVRSDSDTTCTALLALGMSPEDVNHFFPSSKDLAPENDVIVFDAGAGGRFRLTFKPVEGEKDSSSKRLGLTRVTWQQSPEKEPESYLPRGR